jgi:hypothetical protein
MVLGLFVDMVYLSLEEQALKRVAMEKVDSEVAILIATGCPGYQLCVICLLVTEKTDTRWK